VTGPRGLAQELGRVLDRIPSDAGQAVEIAFVVDRSTPWVIPAGLDRAMAANRQRLARVGRTALVSVGFGPAGWSARVDVPLGGDPYDVQRTTRRFDQDPGPRGTAAAWTALDETSHLAWGQSSRPQVILLPDDRNWSTTAKEPPGIASRAPTSGSPEPPAPAGTRERVTAWAQRTGAHLYAVRCRFELDDGRTDPSNAAVMQPDIGDPLDRVPGFFRDGSYMAASSQDALAEALQKALPRATSTPGSLDAALVVDTSGRMGASLSALRGMRSELESFVASPDHRLAIVAWGERPPATSLPFSRSPAAIGKALAGLRSTPSTDQNKDLFGALDFARQLAWEPSAHKVLIVLTATTWYRGSAFSPVTDWTDSAHVVVTFVEAPS
jgi:hypothetical protein